MSDNAPKITDPEILAITNKAGLALAELVYDATSVGQRYERARIVAWLKARAGERMNSAEMLVKSDVLHENDEPEYTRLSAAYVELWTAADEIEAMP